MLEAEARRLCRILLDQRHVSPLLNLGSSTRRFREIVQPHIAHDLFEPLKRAGIAVFHSDLKEGGGIDLAGNVLDPGVRRELKAKGFRCILLANLLEHVRDRNAVAAACEDILGPGGLILASVPFSYPYHADPIDTYYRPSPPELGTLFTRSRVVLAEELTAQPYAEDLRARGTTVWKEAARTALWSLIALARPKGAASRLHRWRWYSRPYRISIVLLEVRRSE